MRATPAIRATLCPSVAIWRSLASAASRTRACANAACSAAPGSVPTWNWSIVTTTGRPSRWDSRSATSLSAPGLNSGVKTLAAMVTGSAAQLTIGCSTRARPVKASATSWLTIRWPLASQAIVRSEKPSGTASETNTATITIDCNRVWRCVMSDWKP